MMWYTKTPVLPFTFPINQKNTTQILGVPRLFGRELIVFIMIFVNPSIALTAPTGPEVGLPTSMFLTSYQPQVRLSRRKLTS